MTALLRYRFIYSLFLFVPNIAHAHVGTGEAVGWAHGMLHPFIGLDHLCAMVAVGMWAAQTGGRALWSAPLTFLGVLALGGLLGMAALPPVVEGGIEGGILASLLVLGVLIAAAVRLPLAASLALVGLFALFHGYAHGGEMPHSTSGLSYALGFMLSTAALHGVGIGMATLLAKTGRLHYLRLAGVALFGGALLFVG
ncbi:MAG: HupE/UreJ family protein [Gallionella sp.]|nr:HupE/UreJ family protein [Gallionella sp.]MDP1941871.1 HupE/UreJ family protein [Gallionella sp.]